ncbi:MAG: DsbA family oxidoreductase [Pseudorhodobacter sp.]
MIRLDIFSDPVCPWCYIGKARLDRALESRPDHPFEIQWHPFQLNPEMPPDGMDRRSYLEAKFGGKAGAVAAYTPVAEAARETGLEINFEAMNRMPNTLNAHRLIHWAGLEGRQNAVVDALFRAYFRDGKDIGDTGTLADIATSCGMDHDTAARLLASGADRDDLMARDLDARKKGVTAVPTYLIAQKYVVSGAQPVELWQKAIDEITGQIVTEDK